MAVSIGVWTVLYTKVAATKFKFIGAYTAFLDKVLLGFSICWHINPGKMGLRYNKTKP